MCRSWISQEHAWPFYLRPTRRHRNVLYASVVAAFVALHVGQVSRRRAVRDARRVRAIKKALAENVANRNDLSLEKMEQFKHHLRLSKPSQHALQINIVSERASIKRNLANCCVRAEEMGKLRLVKSTTNFKFRIGHTGANPSSCSHLASERVMQMTN